MKFKCWSFRGAKAKLKNKERNEEYPFLSIKEL
jgi:hypothetical protein